MVAHGAVLRKNFFTGEQVVAILKDYHQAGLEPEEVVVMDFAAKISRDAHSVTSQDVQSLRDIGLSDTEILDVTLAVSARNLFTRVLDGLGALPNAEYGEKDAEIWAYVMGEETPAKAPVV